MQRTNKLIYIRSIAFLIVILINSCMNKNKNFSQDEKDLITKGEVNSPFYVLQITDATDSLFLRKKCEDIDIQDIRSNKELQLLIQRMKATLFEERGVGLAAPQVGIGRNLFLFVRLDKKDFPVQVAINPKIIAHPEELFCFEGDGCLSIPDQAGNSARYAWIEVEYYDETGVLKKEKLNGGSREEDFTGVIFQHEYDHLQGILFTDKLFDSSSKKID